MKPRLARVDTDAFIDGMLSGDDGGRRLVEGMQAAKLIRAVYSERQLEEVLVDFWMNHFNVFAGKGPVKFMLTRHEEVGAAARVGPLRGPAESDRREPRDALLPGQLALLRARRRQAGGRRRRGLNENYARELMELHTIGVDAGYTQGDVTEVARCFTGWTITPPREDDPRFVFRPRLHERGDKTVLGRRIRSGGREEGDQVLHLLATHPATARRISPQARAPVRRGRAARGGGGARRRGVPAHRRRHP